MLPVDNRMSIKYVYLDINVYLDKTSNYFSDELDF